MADDYFKSQDRDPSSYRADATEDELFACYAEKAASARSRFARRALAAAAAVESREYPRAPGEGVESMVLKWRLQALQKRDAARQLTEAENRTGCFSEADRQTELRNCRRNLERAEHLMGLLAAEIGSAFLEAEENRDASVANAVRDACSLRLEGENYQRVLEERIFQAFGQFFENFGFVPCQGQLREFLNLPDAPTLKVEETIRADGVKTSSTTFDWETRPPKVSRQRFEQALGNLNWRGLPKGKPGRSKS